MIDQRLSSEFLPLFSVVASDVFLLDPFSSISTTLKQPIQFFQTTLSPRAIILCTWASASPQEISRYVSGYTSLFPATRIIVLTTSKSDLVLHHDQLLQHQHLHAAVSAISSPFGEAEQNSHAQVLLHLFGESSAYKACQLLQAHRRITGKALDAKAILFDVAPPYPTSPFETLFWKVAQSWSHTSVAAQIQRDLNDPELIASTAERCYVHPEEDLMTCWTAARTSFVHAEKEKDTIIEVQELANPGMEVEWEEKGFAAVEVDWEASECQGEMERLEWRFKRELVEEGMKSEWGTVDEAKYWKAIEELWA